MKDRILQRYYWPGIFKDVAKYCRGCEVCQRSTPRKPAKAGLVPIPIVTRPFQCVGMDIVGPLPRTQRGNRFILTICNYATRYPEAVALPSVEAPRIARELVHLCSRMGIPDEILTDQGTNFMSSLLEEVYRMLHIKRIRTTPYHPQTDGLVERFNGTLKSMLKKFVNKNGKDWDEYLPYLLFAYREVPQETTGFSPFELLFGRKVRGPLDVLKESWTGVTEPESPVAAYVCEMRKRLQEMAELVQVNADKAQQKQKAYYDRGVQRRVLKEGEKVLVLLPNAHNRLRLEWVGPYKVTRKVSDVDYEVEMPDRQKERRIYHINMMKKWYASDESNSNSAFLAFQMETEYGEEQPEDWNLGEEGICPLEEPASKPEIEESHCVSLSPEQKGQLQSLLGEFPEVLRSVPGRTHLVEHEIHVGEASPIHQKPYRVPYSRRELVKEELDKMLEARIIRPSTSPWASPIVLVPKKDGGVRFCVDYRRLNKVAKFDAYPTVRMEEIFERIGSSNVVSTLDLAKGYWQIPMAANSRDKTAFTTPFGLFEFEVLPFGLHNAPATFQRMMNDVLRDCWSFSGAYIDDVVVFSKSWEEHVGHLREVLTRLKLANLTVKLKKCQFGGAKVHYLGHVIGGGQIHPEEEKVKAVREYPRPVVKKDVRSFLGLVGYYQRFIPQFSAIAAPLTDLTRKGLPDKVKWTEECQVSFQHLKETLIGDPVLRIADPSKPFVLQTDASDRGLGAVLSQVDTQGEEHPVAYASRKLFPRERKYSVIEKECLALVWALKVFHVYLFGQEFVVETDHQPLSWLGWMRNSNAQLTRWSLQIQPYRMTMRHRSGPQNGNADGLSRPPELFVEDEKQLHQPHSSS